MTREELLKIAKPILFNTEMVKAILEGRKTVTRRVIKRDISNQFDCEADGTAIAYIDQATGDSYKPWEVCRFKKGDYLYVRETWCWCPCWDCGMDTEEGCCDKTSEKFYHPERKEYGCYGYRTSFKEKEEPFGRWYPSIHMPKEAARIFLKVTDVRVERLQDITDVEAEREGAAPNNPCKFPPDKWPNKENFKIIWNSTIKQADLDKYGWEANPWVWVIEFERVEV